jgi:hypothetical protein
MASDLLKKPMIQKRLEQLQARTLAKCDMDALTVMINLKEFACRQPSGDPAHDRNTINANTVVAKILGMYREGVDVNNISTSVTVDALNLDFETRLKLLRSMRAARNGNGDGADRAFSRTLVNEE